MQASPKANDDDCFEEDGVRFLKKGSIIDHPDAYKLVHGGFAEAADDECREKVATMSPRSQGTLKKIHDRIIQEQRDFIDELEDEEDEDELEDE